MHKIVYFLVFYLITNAGLNELGPNWEVTDEKGSSAFYDVIEDYSGELVAVGYTNYKSFGGKDMLICKYNSKGELINRNSLGLKKTDMATDIMLMPDGNYLVSGFRRIGGKTEAVILKIGDDLNTLWYKAYSPEANENKCIGTVLLKDDKMVSIINSDVFNFLVLSDLNGNKIHEVKIPSVKGKINDLMVVENDICVVGDYLDKAFVARIDANGETIWQKKFTNTRKSSFQSIVKKDNGQIVSTGYVDTDEQKMNGFFYISDQNGEAIGDSPSDYGGFDDDETYTALVDYEGNILTGGESLSYDKRAKRKNIFFKYLTNDGKVSEERAVFYEKSTNQNDHVYSAIITSTGDMVFAGAMKSFAGASDASIINFGKVKQPKSSAVIGLTEQQFVYPAGKSDLTSNETGQLEIVLENETKKLTPGVTISVTGNSSKLNFRNKLSLSPYLLADGFQKVVVSVDAQNITEDSEEVIQVVVSSKGKEIHNFSQTIVLKRPLVAKPLLSATQMSAAKYLRNEKIKLSTVLKNEGEIQSGDLILVIEDVNNSKKLETVNIKPVTVGGEQNLDLEWEKLNFQDDAIQNFKVLLYDGSYQLLDEATASFEIESEHDYLLRQSETMAASKTGSAAKLEEKRAKLELENQAILKQLETTVKLDANSESESLEKMNAALAAKQAELEAQIKAEEAARLEQEAKLEAERIAFEKAELERKEKEAERLALEAQRKEEAELERKKLEEARLQAEAEKKQLEEARLAQEAALKKAEEEKQKIEAEALKRAEEEAKLQADIEAKKLAAAEKAKLEEAARQKAEEEKQRIAEELKLEEERKAAEEELRKKEEAEKQRLAEELKQKELELKRKEEALKAKAEAEKKKAEELAKLEAEELARKQAEEEERKKLEEELRKEEEKRKQLEA